MLVFDRGEYRTWLKFFKYSQKDVVEILNVRYGIRLNEQGLSNIDNGRQAWRIDVAIGIADIFDIPVEQLFYFIKK